MLERNDIQAIESSRGALETRINSEAEAHRRKKHNFISGIVVDDDLTALIYSYNIFCEFFFFFSIYLSLRAVERGWNRTPPPLGLESEIDTKLMLKL